jgi:hypothetical protein
MEQEALIDIILNDIKEVHALVNTFKGKQELNAAFINLTRTKIANINEELSLLEQLNVKKESTVSSESSLTSTVTAASVQEDNMAIAESSGRFVAGESNMEAKPVAELKQIIDNVATDTSTEVKATQSETIKAADQTKATSPETMSGLTEAMTGDVVTNAASHQATNTNDKTIDASPQTMTSSDKANASSIETSTSTEQTNASESATIRTESKTTASEQPTKQVVNAPSVNTFKKNAKSETKKSVLGEVINQEASSVNDVLANKKEVVEDIKQIGKPVDDVKKAFGLNDRFYYQRELFNNNADLFNQTLDQINSMDTYDSAISFLQSNYSWGSDNEAGEAFIRSIKRRFI